jgi:hypothetical protein
LGNSLAAVSRPLMSEVKGTLAHVVASLILSLEVQRSLLVALDFVCSERRFRFVVSESGGMLVLALTRARKGRVFTQNKGLIKLLLQSPAQDIVQRLDVECALPSLLPGAKETFVSLCLEGSLKILSFPVLNLTYLEGVLLELGYVNREIRSR